MTLAGITNALEAESDDVNINRLLSKKKISVNMINATIKNSEINHIKKEKSYFKRVILIICIIFIINFILFEFYPEQFYVQLDDIQRIGDDYMNVNDLKTPLDLTKVLLNSTKTCILDGPPSNYNRFIDALYFTTTQFSTIGYGDISARKPFSKKVCIITHILIIFLSFRFIGGVIEDLSKGYIKNIISKNGLNPKDVLKIKVGLKPLDELKSN